MYKKDKLIVIGLVFFLLVVLLLTAASTAGSTSNFKADKTKIKQLKTVNVAKTYVITVNGRYAGIGYATRDSSVPTCYNFCTPTPFPSKTPTYQTREASIPSCYKFCTPTPFPSKTLVGR